jgi:DNA-directed RNA polymerase subunit E'
MFKLIRCTDVVRIPPEQFGQDLLSVAQEQLRLKYEGTIREGTGYIVAVIAVDIDPVGKLVMGDGATYHKVTFSLLTFLPQLHEVVEGEVVEVEDFGAFIRIGPVDALLHISQILDDVISYDERHAALIGKDTRKELRKGDLVRVRVTALSLTRGGASGKVGVTARQPFLGKLSWIEEEVKKMAQQTASTPESK